LFFSDSPAFQVFPYPLYSCPLEALKLLFGPEQVPPPPQDAKSNPSGRLAAAFSLKKLFREAPLNLFPLGITAIDE